VTPADEAARSRARSDHGTSLVIEAGAGTGKTTLLVDRIASIVTSGAARLDEIAAVTFTENAATTMKLRLRERLERLRRQPDAADVERERADSALGALERAQISTIHALCAAILGERPLECGVVPGFRVTDEAETDLLFARAWEEWLAERMLEGDSLLVDTLDSGIPLEGIGRFGERTSLRGLARTLLEQRDLEPLTASDAAEPERWRDDLRERAARARELSKLADPVDNLAQHLEQFVTFAETADSLQGRALRDHLLAMETIRRNSGFKPRWESPESLAQGRAIAEWTHSAKARWSQAQGAALHGQLVEALGDVVKRYEKLKRERGALDFVDLLLLARNALRDSEAVRRHFRRRFRLLLIDEFQDTDPLQVEVARLLAAETPGGLVVVGDAKQSIYRFRRAEVALFRRASEEAGRSEGRAVLRLTQNFRSRPAILRFVNRVFGELIQASDEADQPEYQPLQAPPGLSEDASVVALHFEAGFAEGEDLLRAEAGALATYLARAAHGRLSVRDPGSGENRASHAGDVLVLVRRLTQVRTLEEALEAAGLRFTVEGGKSFFDRQEIHEVLAVIQAVCDPSDRVSLVAALRSSFFGVSDRDITSYALDGGRISLGPVDAQRECADALGPALDLLEELHRAQTGLRLPALLERLYDRTRILAALSGTRRGQGRIANLEKVVALARQSADLGVLTLRGFAGLLRERIDSAREEPDLPTTRPGDPNTLRILSVHKAKGLEAPIVALYDTADDNRSRPNIVPLWEEQRVAIGFRAGCQPPNWDELRNREEAKGAAEAQRLLYVACTRARDWLVIPVAPPTAKLGSFWAQVARKLPRSSDEDVIVVDAEGLPVPEARYKRSDLKPLANAEGVDPLAVRWERERRERIATAAARPLTPVSATRVAARDASAPVELTGSSISSESARGFGSLVHRVLEWIPFSNESNAGARAMAQALAPNFGLDADDGRRAGDVVAQVLGLPVITRARKAESVWRELPVWFPEGEELVEGVIDLVFEEDGELVVVDYKTDRISAEQILAQAAHHAPQLQLYGRGLARATGQRIRQRLVVFTALGREIPV
jgi:ATP-dependent helicase/nuclease subunit A